MLSSIAREGKRVASDRAAAKCCVGTQGAESMSICHPKELGQGEDRVLIGRAISTTLAP